MIFRIVTLSRKFEKAFKKGPVPMSAWEQQGTVRSTSFVKADQRARKLHPGRIVHTYHED